MKYIDIYVHGKDHILTIPEGTFYLDRVDNFYYLKFFNKEEYHTLTNGEYQRIRSGLGWPTLE